MTMYFDWGSYMTVESNRLQSMAQAYNLDRIVKKQPLADVQQNWCS